MNSTDFENRQCAVVEKMGSFEDLPPLAMWHIGEIPEGVVTVGMRLTRIYKEVTDFKLTREPHEYIMAPYANIHAHGDPKPAHTQGRSLHRYQTSEISVEVKRSPESATGDGLFPYKITMSNLLNSSPPPKRKLRCLGVKCASKRNRRPSCAHKQAQRSMALLDRERSFAGGVLHDFLMKVLVETNCTVCIFIQEIASYSSVPKIKL